MRSGKKTKHHPQKKVLHHEDTQQSIRFRYSTLSKQWVRHLRIQAMIILHVPFLQKYVIEHS